MFRTTCCINTKPLVSAIAAEAPQIIDGQGSSSMILFQTGAIGGAFLLVFGVMVWLVRSIVNDIKTVNDKQRLDYQKEESERKTQAAIRDERISKAFDARDREIARVNKEYADLAIKTAEVNTRLEGSQRELISLVKDLGVTVAQLQAVIAGGGGSNENS